MTSAVMKQVNQNEVRLSLGPTQKRPQGHRVDPGPPLTFLVAHVGVEALGLEHDEERAPSQQHGGEEQVLDDGRHRHPPAPAERGGQSRSHGWRWKETWSGAEECRRRAETERLGPCLRPTLRMKTGDLTRHGDGFELTYRRVTGGLKIAGDR